MATTTNFGWETPDDTDLVKDGAAAIRTALGGVDTSFVDLKGGTTGQILSKTSNTDLDFTWVTNDVGDITAVTAGTGITGGGTSGAVTITNDMATTITTNGDLIYGTGSGTYTRRGIGSTGQVLTVSGGVPAWATPSSGGMTSIASGSLSSTTLTINSIPATYTHLQLVIRNFKTTVDGSSSNIRFNGDTNTRYQRFVAYGNSGVTAFGESSIQIMAGNSSTNSNGLTILDINDYANTATWKTCNWLSANDEDATGGGMQNNVGYGVYNQAAAISSITIRSGAGTMSGTYILYGVK